MNIFNLFRNLKTYRMVNCRNFNNIGPNPGTFTIFYKMKAFNSVCSRYFHKYYIKQMYSATLNVWLANLLQSLVLTMDFSIWLSYVISSMITVTFVFSLGIAKNNEFYKTKRVFCSFFLDGSIKTILRVKRSSGVILAISGHFFTIEKARMGAILLATIGSL